ncbi:MAG TPA: hypothetical protein VM223_02080 [Planctomycetota bacterium]|nr:hypothetical protein [Planctomycetota bacterium]
MNRIHGLPLVFISMFTMGWVHGGEQGATKVDTLARHETVAEFRGANYHRCMGLTSLCPDKCGHSGTLAKFKIVNYLSYEKLGEYGDPKCDEFVFLVEDNMKHAKVPADIRDAVSLLKQGDIVLLSWKHDLCHEQRRLSAGATAHKTGKDRNCWNGGLAQSD